MPSPAPPPTVTCSEFVCELEQLARLAAGQADLRLIIGEPGTGWSLNWRTRVISIDGGRLQTQTPDFTRGLVLHESAHAAITRLSDVLPQVTLQNQQVFPLLNLLEDCRIETWMQARFPGCAPWIREYNDCLFQPLLTDNERAPTPVQFLRGIAGRWWFGKVPEATETQVRQALEEVWLAFQEMLRALPPSPEAVGGMPKAYTGSAVSRCYATRDREHPPSAFEQAVRLAQHQMWVIVHRNILPVFRGLLPPDKEHWHKAFCVRFLQAMPGQFLDGFGQGEVWGQADSLGLGLIHGASAEPGQELGASGLDAYHQAWQRQSAAIELVGESLLRWFQVTKRTGFRDGCPWGTRLLLRAAMRFEADPRAYDRLWRRPLIPKKINAHFSVVVDRSGSMQGEKMQETFQGVVLLCEVCRRAGVPLNVYAFAGQVERLLEHNEELSDAVQSRLGTLPEVTDGGTNLAEALEMVAADLAESPFQDRFVFVLSDGMPHDEQAVRAQIVRLTGDEVALVGLGLGPDTEKLAEFFPLSRVNLAAKQLPGVLAELLVRCLAKR